MKKTARRVPRAPIPGARPSITIDMAVPQDDDSVMQQRPTFYDFDKAIAFLSAQKPPAMRMLARVDKKAKKAARGG